MKKVALFALAALAIIGFSGSGVYAQSSNQTVSMTALNGSDQGGTTTITDLGNGKVKVVIDIKSGGSQAQPAHLHKGTCSNADPTPAYPLSNVVNGKSETTVDVGMAELGKGYLVNVHKSAQDIPTYVSCGDIAMMAMGQGGDSMPGTGNGEQNAIFLALALLAATMTGAGLKLARRKA